MDSDWIPVIGALGFTALIVTSAAINKIIKYKLEIERIKADTAIKTEEIRVRNQLEIEKMLMKDEDKSYTRLDQNTHTAYPDPLLEKPSQERVRV